MNEENKAEQSEGNKAEQNGALVFDDVDFKEVAVTIGKKKYTLREASGAVACQYRNKLMECTELGEGGKPKSVKGIADVEPFLVSRCLVDENNHLVPEQTIKAWRAIIGTGLFKELKKISELGEEGDDLKSLYEQREELNQRILRAEEDAAKNEPSATTVGSA